MSDSSSEGLLTFGLGTLAQGLEVGGSWAGRKEEEEAWLLPSLS